MAKMHSGLGRISGTIGGFVFKTYRGKTVLSKKPKFTKPWSKAQVATRKTFKAASDYSESVKADPVLREAYRQRGRRLKLNYRQMALRDAFNPPRVDSVDRSRFKPQQGGELVITAFDDFEVIGVQVTLHDSSGRVVASGDATPSHGRWRFEVPPATSAARAPVSIEVAARDRPGNVTTRTFPLT
jgi:hypothetical protein